MTKTCVICKKQPVPGNITRSFHKFPVNSKLKQKWMEIIGIQDVKKVSTVCSDHFRDDSYHQTDGYTKTRRLLSTAVPVLSRNNSALKQTNNIVIPSSIEVDNKDEYSLSNSLDSSKNTNKAVSESSIKDNTSNRTDEDGSQHLVTGIACDSGHLFSQPTSTEKAANDKIGMNSKRFPKGIDDRQKSLKMLNKEEWIPKINYVHSKHYEQKCFPHRGSHREKLPNDMENFMKYSVMGPVGKIKMKAGCLPSKFACQPDRVKRTASPPPRSAVVKRRRRGIIEEVLSEAAEMPATSGMTSSGGTMDEETNGVDVKEEMSSECRTCLQTISSDTELYYIFQSWVPPWEGIDYTIAEALEKLAQVQISAVDQYSKMICGVCCQKLYSACVFTTLIQQSDQTLRQRHASGLQTEGTAEDNWPKPIKINVNIPADDQIGVEVKKEVLSDDEDSEYSRVVEGHSDLANMDIKIEPVELVRQRHSRVALNGNGEGSNIDNQTPGIPSLNGDECSQDLFSIRIKEEPVSDNESIESDLSLDCMLCTKVFNSVSGLKAHVIAHHSYKSVRRKAENEASPAKRKKNEYHCGTCRRSFATSTDLMVHETCHKKSVCYGCNEKFDSFELVMQHRLTCKAINNKGQVAVITLEDVQRQPRPVVLNEDDEEEKPAQLLKCALCNEQFTDNYYMNIHLEIHHPASRQGDDEVDAIESLFTERA